MVLISSQTASNYFNVMFSTSVIPSNKRWEKFGKEVFEIEQAIFQDKAFSEEMLKLDLSDNETILAILQCNEEVIGFVYAMPEESGCCSIVDIAIVSKYQNIGPVGTLMNCIEQTLVENEYVYMEEYAMVENGYAKSIEKHYGSRIVSTHEHIGEYGKQQYFKILL